MILLDVIRHQEPVIDALRGARERGRLAHAHLFWGPEGVGKLRAAQALAQMLLCTRDAPPCGTCLGCERTSRFTHPDLHVVLPARRGAEGEQQKALEEYGRDLYHHLPTSPPAAIGIERVRGLKIESSKAQVEVGNRVIIIRDAESLTLEAAQAALKLIEEPRAGTYLVLTCRDPAHLLPTIVSRCQRLRFRPLPRGFVEAVLREHAGVSPAEAALLAGLSQGSLGRALSMGAVDVLALRERARELFSAPARACGEITRRVQALGGSADAAAVRALADVMLSWHADLVALRAGLDEEMVTHADQIAALRLEAQRTSVVELGKRVALLEELLASIERNVNPGLALQVCLLRFHGLVEGEALPEGW